MRDGSNPNRAKDTDILCDASDGVYWECVRNPPDGKKGWVEVVGISSSKKNSGTCQVERPNVSGQLFFGRECLLPLGRNNRRRVSAKSLVLPVCGWPFHPQAFPAPFPPLEHRNWLAAHDCWFPLINLPTPWQQCHE